MSGPVCGSIRKAYLAPMLAFKACSMDTMQCDPTFSVTPAAPFPVAFTLLVRLAVSAILTLSCSGCFVVRAQ